MFTNEKKTNDLMWFLQAGDVDDSELISSYDKQYEKVKKKAKGKLPPIDSMSELSFDEKVLILIFRYISR